MKFGDTFNDYPDAVAYEPSSLLAKLKAEASYKSPVERPQELTVRQIRRVPELFQPRRTKEDERHIQELARAVRNTGMLDPILVMYIGRHPYLIDGHHRLAAYEQARVTAPVPVEYFQGTIEQAVLAAGRANSKAKLPMRSHERQDFAWKLVLLGGYSKRETVEAAGVADGQVAIMRRVQKALGPRAYDFTSWWQAHRVARGLHEFKMTDEERATWRDELAARLADQIAKACGPKFTDHPEVAAMVLARLFGRHLEDLAGCLRDFLPEDSDAEENLDF